jgi:hypothetical protein
MDTVAELNQAVVLFTAINAFIANVTEKVLRVQNAESDRIHGQPYAVLTHDKPGASYVRIIMTTLGTSRSCWAFVALKDGNTKGMGSFKRGDILKAASWQAPAKHARGNVFQPGENGCCNVSKWTGPNYLK